MKKFIENKSIGYWIAVADAFLALFLGIFYIATYKQAIGNNAAGNVPETVGIFMLAGFVIECVLLVLPQYGFISLFAMAMFGISFYKEVYLIPDFIAGKANNVEYNGGNFNLNLIYIIIQFVILISAIVAAFIGFYKKDDDAKEDFKLQKNPLGIAKVAGGLVLIVAAVLTSTLTTSAVQRKAEEEAKEQLRLAEEYRIKNMFNPITDEIKAAAEANDYEHIPEELIIKEKETWNFDNSKLNSIPVNKSRTDAWLVYSFEGAYSEGWQGDYSATYCYLYLWSDGLFGGTSGKDNLRGYWYNSSLDKGVANGVDVADCLNMVSNINHFEKIKANTAQGFYQYDLWMYLDMGKVWNQGTNGRSIHMTGYRYYPEIGIDINMGVLNDHVYYVGDEFNTSTLKIVRILKNLSYGTIFGSATSSITITDPDGVYDADKKVFVKKGDITITATYNGFTKEKTITVVPAPAVNPAA